MTFKLLYNVHSSETFYLDETEQWTYSDYACLSVYTKAVWFCNIPNWNYNFSFYVWAFWKQKKNTEINTKNREWFDQCNVDAQARPIKKLRHQLKLVNGFEIAQTNK